MTEMSATLEAAIRAEIAPALGLDGEGIEVVGIDEGVVQVRFNGACASCPATVWVMMQGLEGELRQRFAWVEYLEAVR